MPVIDMCPDTAVLNSIVEMSGGTLRGMLAELFDNCLDQDATRIELRIEGHGNNRILVIEDNGNGISDWGALFRLGRHVGNGRRVGRYGVGFKHAVIWLAEVVEVETRHKDFRSYANVNWPQMATQGNNWKWNIPEPYRDEGPSYTRITLSNIRRNRIRNFEQVISELAYRYTPGLLEGAQIIINGQSLEPVPMAAFAGEPLIVEGIFTGEDEDEPVEKAYRFTAGVKADHAEPGRCGWDVAYLHRLIRQHESRGFGGYSMQRFYGYLELLNTGEDDWTLAEHKDDFAEADALFDSLFPMIEPLLKQAEQAKETLEFRDCQRLINERLQQAGYIREKRPNKANEKGAREPKETGQKRKQATAADPTQVGSVVSRLRGKGVSVAFDCHQPNRVGDVQSGPREIVVSLNPSFPVVKSKNPDAIIGLVCSLLILHPSWLAMNQTAFFREMQPQGTIEELSGLLQKVLTEEIRDEVAAAVAV